MKQEQEGEGLEMLRRVSDQMQRQDTRKTCWEMRRSRKDGVIKIIRILIGH